MDFDVAIKEFKNYTSKYIELGDSVTLKIDHTFRVMKLCEEIAKSLNFSDEDIELAKLCGLLHDIGRFEQWKNYQTFADRLSVDHGDLGVKILTTDNYIRNFISDDEYDNIILTSVEFHNKYEIPDGLTEKELIFTKLVRDADKIDILYLYTIGHIELNIEDSYFSDLVYNSLLSRKEILRTDLKTLADKLSISLGFIFDINYEKSFDILKNNKYFEIIVNYYKNKSTSDILKKQLDDVLDVINSYIEKRLNDVR